MCAIESWMYFENCKEFVISYFSGGYLQLSDSIFGQRKKPVPLIGQLKNPNMVPNK